MAGSSSIPSKMVCVFGASWCKPGDALYLESEALGTAIAKAGFDLINGGYMGSMEGSAKGHKAAGTSQSAEGVIVPTLFRSRDRGNPFLSRVTHAPSLLRRIEHMVESAHYFVVMPGTLGTLTELCAVWSKATLATEGHYRPPRIFAYRKPWEEVIVAAVKGLGIPPDFAAHVHYVENADEAVAAILADAAADAAAAAAPEGGASAMPTGSV